MYSAGEYEWGKVVMENDESDWSKVILLGSVEQLPYYSSLGVENLGWSC